MDPVKLLKIDESLISEYSNLEPTDHCFFLGDYASRRGFNHSEMNQVINNFKKPVERKDRQEWYYKEQAILKVANWFVSTSTWEKLKKFTWIPMPPSKIKKDPQYDDRLWKVLLKMQEFEPALDIRELLLAKSSREAAHNPGAVRPKVPDHLNNLVLDESQREPNPQQGIVLFDDIITSGAHFKAAQIKIKKEYFDGLIVGLFVARNIRVDDA